MWKFKGVIFDKHHAQLPTVITTENGFRVYYSTKMDGKSYIRFFDIDDDLNQIGKDNLALSLGKLGTFDQSGVMPSCIVGNLMYYTGWHLRADVPYSHSIGVATINEDGTLSRNSDGPILGHNFYSPYLLNSPFVEFDENKKMWKMYYCNGTGWVNNHPTYNISAAYSDNKIDWKTSENIEITMGLKDEAISRVCRDCLSGILYFYKTSTSSYDIFSKNSNGEIFNVEIDRNNWDSNMRCYPWVCRKESNKYLFYNGNNYGLTGIGVAKWKEDIG